MLENSGTDILQTLMLKRRSVRGFTSDLVDKVLIDKALSVAQLSPSNCNVQPWHVSVVSGQTLEVLKAKLTEMATASVIPKLDFGFHFAFEGVHRARQVHCGAELYKAMGVKRDDKEGRKAVSLRNFEAFGAPHVAIIGMSAEYDVINSIDVGIYVQSLLLALSELGIASCPQGALAHYPDVVREVLGIDQSVGILMGIAFGYEDVTHPANQIAVSRASIEESVTFF